MKLPERIDPRGAAAALKQTALVRRVAVAGEVMAGLGDLGRAVGRAVGFAINNARHPQPRVEPLDR